MRESVVSAAAAAAGSSSPVCTFDQQSEKNRERPRTHRTPESLGTPYFREH